ncbi:ATP-dependent helicase, partial [Streptomyces sp. TRM76130]|nr:ATP-dependent helicase [Streptomyces sp. TRM76130]
GDDLAAAVRAARRGGDAYGARWRAEARRLRGVSGEAAGRSAGGPGEPAARRKASGAGDAGRAGRADGASGRVAGLVAALAFPERVAREDGGSYLMASGTRAELAEGSALHGAPWIAVAVADRPVGRRHARVRLGAVIDED